MKFRVSFFGTLFLVMMLGAPLAAQDGGVQPDWDVRKMLSSVVEQTKRLQPLLEQVQPQEWVAQGAPDAYKGQLEALKNEIGYLERTANELAQKPDWISKTLEVYFRLDAVKAMMGSINEGVRRYQNPAVADILQSVLDENEQYSVQLKDYLVQLVAQKEVECKIADEEAQRCRTEIISRPASSSERGR